MKNVLFFIAIILPLISGLHGQGNTVEHRRTSPWIEKLISEIKSSALVVEGKITRREKFENAEDSKQYYSYTIHIYKLFTGNNPGTDVNVKSQVDNNLPDSGQLGVFALITNANTGGSILSFTDTPQIIYQLNNNNYTAKFGKKELHDVAQKVYPLICNLTKKQYLLIDKSPVDDQVERMNAKNSSLPCGLTMNLMKRTEDSSTTPECRTIKYTFKNVRITHASGDTFVEFDIYASQNTPNLLYTGGDIYFFYGDTGIFSSSSGGISVTKGEITETSIYSIAAVDTFCGPWTQPGTGAKISVSTSTNTNLYNIGLSAQQLCHVKLMYMPSKSGGIITFDSLTMQVKSSYYDILAGTQKMYDVVYTGYPLSILRGDCASGSAIKYGLTGGTISTTSYANLDQITFNVTGTSTVQNDDGDNLDVDYAGGTIVLNCASAFASSMINFGDGQVTSVDYSLTYSQNQTTSAVTIDIDNTSGSYSAELDYNTQTILFTVTMTFPICNGSAVDAGITFSSESNSQFNSDDPDLDGLNNYCTISNDASTINNNLCSACVIASSENAVSFTFSNPSVLFSTSPPGPDQGTLQFTVNFLPTAQFGLTTGSFYSSTIVIDYNATALGDITTDLVFQNSGIVLSSALLSSGTTVSTTGSSPGILKILLNSSSSPVPFNFNPANPIPLFTVNMPFDNSVANIGNCNVACNVVFDNIMNSAINSNPVLTQYESNLFTGSAAFCSETPVTNSALQNQFFCPYPEISFITAGINEDQCPTAGSMIPVQIHGSNFLNGYTWVPAQSLNNTFTGAVGFINANQGDDIANSNPLNGSAITTAPIDILNWTNDLIELLIPGADDAGVPEPPGTGPFEIIAPVTNLISSTTANSIYIEYALENQRPTAGGALAMEYLTTTQTATAGTSPYNTFPLYTFDVNADFFNNDPPVTNQGGGAVSTLSQCLTEIQCTIGVPFVLDQFFATNKVNNETASASDGINEILMVPSTNSIWSQLPDNPLGTTVYSGDYYEVCTDYSSSNPNYPYGASTYVRTGIDIYILEDPNPQWDYGGGGSSYPSALPLQEVIDHELGHGMLLGHSNHNPANSNDAQTRIMYEETGWYNTVYFNDLDDSRGAIRTLQWPTNADGQTYNGITLQGSCSTATPPATQHRPSDCFHPVVPAACSFSDPPEGIPNITNEITNFTMQVYPNPSGNNPILYVDIYERSNFDIRVYDILGNLISQTQLTSDLPFKTTLDMGEASPGIYLLNVLRSNDGSQRSIKFIKTY